MSRRTSESAAGFYRSALKSDPDNVFLLERALVLSAAAGDIDDALGFAKTAAREAAGTIIRPGC